MDFEMGEREDFGDWGDERFLGLCAEDWLDDRRNQMIELRRELAERKAREELELEFADYDPDKGDDIGQELDMADPNYDPHINLDDDYLNCSWEE